MFKTFEVEAVAKILYASEATILQFVDAGDSPEAKIGNAWVFDSQLVHNYLLNEIKSQTYERKKKIIF